MRQRKPTTVFSHVLLRCRTLAALALTLCAVAGCHPTATPTANGMMSPDEVRVQLIHFSDYHSHAIPFYSEHKPDQGGLARTLAYIAGARARDQSVIALSGGDMWNAGTPAWSDKYYDGCADWKWLGEYVSVMAFGNHDVDYGWDALKNCQKQSGIQILSGNLVDGNGGMTLLIVAGTDAIEGCEPMARTDYEALRIDDTNAIAWHANNSALLLLGDRTFDQLVQFAENIRIR